jgi:hypothetical protein
LLVVLLMPATVVLSKAMWWHSPWTAHGPHPSAGYQVLAQVLDCFQVTSAIMGALTLAGLGRGSRYLPARRVPAAVLLSRLMGIGLLAFVAADMVLGTVIYIWSVRIWHTAALTWPPMLVGGTVIVLVFGLLARAALGCLRVSSTGPAPAAPE